VTKGQKEKKENNLTELDWNFEEKILRKKF